jgi:hypothetical protein
MAEPREPDFLVRLRPLKDATPAIHRLRHFLKAALRCWGLRAVSVEELRPPTAPPTAPPPASKGELP